MTTYDPKTGEPLLLTAEVASMFEVSTRTICYWADQGKLPCTRTSRGHRRFKLSDVEKLLSAHSAAQNIHRAIAKYTKQRSSK